LRVDFKMLKTFNALYVEDDLNVQKHTYNSLAKFFNSVEVCDSIKKAEEIYLQKELDVIFVDINLLDGSGLEWIKSVRTLDTTTSFVVITSSSALNDLLFAIPLRLEDYIIKPLTFDKLRGAFLKILENHYKNNNKKFRFPNDVVYNYLENILYKNQEPFQLTKHEANFLELLISNIDMVVSYEKIERELYQDRPLNRGTLRNHTKKLRDIIGVEYITSITDRGYKLTFLTQ